MTPVMPCSMSNVSLIPGTAFTTRKNNCLKRFSLSRKRTKLTPSTQKHLLPLSTSIKLIPLHCREFFLHRPSRINRLSATETDVAVEESDSPIADEDSGGASETPPDALGSSEKSTNGSDTIPTPTQSRRTRPVRKSEMPPIKNEELVPGATFTGKVRSIQPFGAFVDFGAFTDGLVHVSRLSDSYVKDVGDIVSVGQEVKVRLVEADMETGRISLSMRESDDTNNLQQQKDASAGSDKAGAAKRNVANPKQRRDEAKRSSKFVKGQDLEGTVKNLARSGAFISLPEGEEGFLPTSEESDEGFANVMGNSSLQVGQEVSVRVLRISRGKVTLTMKKEEDVEKLDAQLNQGVVHVATNPFVLAFHKNKDIASFLDERQKLQKAAEKPAIKNASEVLEEKVHQSNPGSDEVQDQPSGSNERLVSVPSTIGEISEDDATSLKEADVGVSALEDDASTNIADDKEDPASSSTQSIDGAVQTIDKEAEASAEILSSEETVSSSSQIAEEASPTDGVERDGKSDLLGGIKDEASPKVLDMVPSPLDEMATNVANDVKDPESTISSSTPRVDGAVQTIEKEAEVSSEVLAPEVSVATVDQISEEAPPTDGLESDGKSDSSGEISGKIVSSESPEVEDIIEGQTDAAVVTDETNILAPNTENEPPHGAQSEDNKVHPNPDENGSINSSGLEPDARTQETEGQCPFSPFLFLVSCVLGNSDYNSCK